MILTPTDGELDPVRRLIFNIILIFLIKKILIFSKSVIIPPTDTFQAQIMMIETVCRPEPFVLYSCIPVYMNMSRGDLLLFLTPVYIMIKIGNKVGVISRIVSSKRLIFSKYRSKSVTTHNFSKVQPLLD